jgi:hypothetical protein
LRVSLSQLDYYNLVLRFRTEIEGEFISQLDYYNVLLRLVHAKRQMCERGDIIYSVA